MDPYKILGVSSSATDDEIKKAYRDLIKKNHPDKFQDAAEKARATEAVKKYNAAYDEIQAIRSGKGSYSNNGGYNSYGSGSGYGSYGNGSYYEQVPKYAQVYAYINSGNLNTAENILDGMSERDAEWHYLKGVIYLRRQWFDAAKKSFETAVMMEPDNMKYQQAYRSMGSYGGYRNFYGSDSSIQSCEPCDICSALMCADCLCSSLRFC